MMDLLLAAAFLFLASAGIVAWQIRASKDDAKTRGLRSANRADKGERR